MSKEPVNHWPDSIQLAVLGVVYDDKGFTANVSLICPACKKPTLDYERFTQFDFIAWCRHCRAGISQGDGEAMSKKKAEPA